MNQSPRGSARMEALRNSTSGPPPGPPVVPQEDNSGSTEMSNRMKRRVMADGKVRVWIDARMVPGPAGKSIAGFGSARQHCDQSPASPSEQHHHRHYQHEGVFNDGDGGHWQIEDR